jgi:serine/threonine protein kinase
VCEDADVGQLDYCPGGEVFSYLRRARRFNEPTSQFYAAEIVLILEFLHEREGVAYRDLKPENILIDAEGHLKLVDFGFAKKVENRQFTFLRRRNRALTSCRGDLHSLRHSRVSGTGGHKKYRWVALVPAQWLNSHS